MTAPRCPICHATPAVRRQLSPAQIADALSPTARDAERNARMLAQVERLWPGGIIDVCVCETCQLGFAWPLVEGDGDFYAVLHERTGYPRERWEFRETRERFLPAAGKVLDVGTGRGDFLVALPASLERHAVEASATLCDALATRGIAAHDSLSHAQTGGPFALITLFHVLQYFADPVAAIARCRSMLAAEGRLILSLPNAAAPGDALDDLRSPPHPLTRWSRPAVERALAQAGLTVERFEYIPLKASSLMWAANGKTKAKALARPTSVAGKVDAMTPGQLRTALLVGLSTLQLPAVMRHAHGRLRRSQMYVVARCA